MRHGTPDARPAKPALSQQVILDNTHQDEDGCLIWSESVDKDGYPRYYDSARHKAGLNPLVAVHRWVVEQTSGPLRRGQIVEQTCDKRLCVLPSHLNVATTGTGRKTRAGINARKTHCDNEHELTEDNIYWAEGGRRQCKQCRWESAMRHQGLDPSQLVRRGHIYTPQTAAAFMRERGWDPIRIDDWVDANSPWWCRCIDCLMPFPKQLGNVRDGRASCRNCFAIAFAAEAFELMVAADLEPLTSYRRSGAPWPSRCLRTGETTAPAHAAVKQRGHQCVACGVRRISAANQLADAEARDQLPPHLVPLDVYPGTILKPWKMLCTDCDAIHEPGISLNNAKRRGKGCPNCGHNGIDYQKPGYLYLISHRSFNALKWGIANGEVRLRQHKGQHWKVERRWDFELTSDARAIERQIEDYVRDQGIPASLTPNQMPYGGWSETASLDLITLNEVEQQIEEFHMQQRLSAA